MDLERSRPRPRHGLSHGLGKAGVGGRDGLVVLRNGSRPGGGLARGYLVPCNDLIRYEHEDICICVGCRRYGSNIT